MVEKFGVEKVSKIPASLGVPTLSRTDEQQTSEERKEVFQFPYQEAVGAFM